MATSAFENKVTTTTCPYCGVGCGVDVSVVNQRPIELKGNRSHPANLGKLCVKGSHLLDTITQKGRLTTPKIDGKPVSWSQAINATAQGLLKTIEQYGADSVAFYVSGQLLTEDYYVVNKLIKGYIGTANIDTNSRLCMASAVAGYKRAFGSDTVPCDYSDLENTELLILIGSNAAWTHPILFQRMQQAKVNNPQMKIVVIDPRSSATAQQADLFLPIQPGSDIILFNGLLNYLIENNHTDEPYIEQHCENWLATKNAVSTTSIEYVAQKTGLDKLSIEQFYQLFATTTSSLSFYSQGVNQSKVGVDKCNSIINCHLATGKIGKIGSGPFSITGQPNAMGGREVGGLANMLAAHMDIDNPQHRSLVQEFWQSPTIPTKLGLKAVDMFNAIEQGKIKAIWIMATNPLVSLPNQNAVKQALSKCELVIVSDCMESNDTLQCADIALPATGWSEKDGTVTNSERRISRQRAFVTPTGEAKHDWQIVCDVAKEMGFSNGFNYQTAAQIFTEHAALSGYKNTASDSLRDFDISGLASLTQKQYDALEPVQWPVNDHYPYGRNKMFDDGRYYTPSGKANFIAIQTKEDQLTNTNYPFILNSGRYRDHWHTMTRTGLSATLSRHLMMPMLHINPQDAKSLGLVSDDIVNVTSQHGEVQLPIHITAEQQIGQLFAPIHWSDQNASNAKVSQCFSSAVDPISGQPDSKSVAVSVAKVIMKHFIQIFSRTELTLHCDFWVKVTTPFGYQYIAAQQTTIDDMPTWLDQHFPNTSWSSLQNGATKETWSVQSDKDLKAILIHSELPITPVLPWIDDLFAREPFTEQALAEILSQQIDKKFTQGPTVCSCYQVGEFTIVDAIQQGCNTVEQLGKSLSCGTKCGSCKPELSQLINNHSSRKNIKIDSTHIIKTENSYV